MSTETQAPPAGCVIISDIHAERHFESRLKKIIPIPENVDETLLILAGDIGNVKDGSLAAALHIAGEAWEKVLFVPGNHDYWGLEAGEEDDSALDEADALLQDLAAEHGVSMLQCDIELHKKKTIAGCTLWSDVTAATVKASFYMNDYGCIEGFTVLSSQGIHAVHRAWLEDVTTDPTIDVDIVVTHHAPYLHGGPVHRTADEETEMFFRSDLSSLFLKHDFVPRFWVFGHTHLRTAIRVERPDRMLMLYTNALGHYGFDFCSRWTREVLLHPRPLSIGPA